MFKKLVIASAVLAASSGVAFAGHAYKGDYKGESVPACPTCPTYSFMSGPYVGLSAGVRNTYTGDPAVYKGMEGTLSLGYAGAFSPMFYLAGELFVADSFVVDNFPGAAGESVRTTWQWGGSVIPGIMINDWVMGYARVGGQSTRFNGPGVTKGGWHVGIGAQTNLAPCWDLRTEYVYYQYGHISDLGTPAADIWNLGVVYKFM